MSKQTGEIAEKIYRSSEGFWIQHPLLKEFIRDQIPMILGVFIAAVVVSYMQYGFLPGGDVAFPIAGMRVPIWHLLWMGFWTGYTMGIVGEASGIFALPYSMSVLQFSSVAVSPTTLIVTFLNPFGALLGFWRNRQWNWDLAKWLCLGAVLGAPIGPFIRVYLLNDPLPFKAAIGLALLIMSIHLCMQVTPWYLKRTARQRAFKEKFDALVKERLKAGKAPSGLPADFRIQTLESSFKRVKIGYWGEEQSFNVPTMLMIGFGVGVISAALGVGGGFILVPILVSFYGLPLYVMVAATIPFVITLSLTGLLSYTITMPILTGVSASPDWSFGLFVASGAIFGAWVASKTQKFIPERFLKPMLGVVTGAVALLYIINFFWKLPFKV
ncbi:MAG: sulfite exporter TauE/SafE family protein [Nitrospirae bacterium]|nr:sulfite exporter TauE/SafE family protein [Nitrospirota bacterium]